MRTRIKNLRIWQDNGIFTDGELYITDEKISAPFEEADTVLDGQGLYACPGLLDLHTHGRAGHDFCDADETALITMALDYAKHGVTALTPTLASDTLTGWQKALKRVAKTPSPSFLGIHLEGRYLSPARRGAHAAELLTAPDAGEVLSFAKLVAPLPLRVSYAPELDTDGSFLAAMREAGISLSMGHTDADCETALAAIRQGVCAATHLFNAMPPLHHRAGGAVAAALTEDIYTEVICDGLHIAPEVVKLTYRTKGKERLVLITDSMAGTGCSDGEYGIAGQPVTLKNGRALTPDGRLAGSTLNLLDGVRNLAAFAGISFGEALTCATLTPAALAGLSGRLGTLALGARADLFLLSPDQLMRQGSLPARVMQNGRWIK